MYRRDAIDDASAGLAALLMVGVVAMAIGLLALLVATLAELARIYRARAFQPTPTARLLWLALVGLLGAWLIAGLLAGNPADTPQAAYLAAWSFLVFCLVVEACDLFAARQEKTGTDLNAAGLLDVAPAAHRDNGYRQNGQRDLALEEWVPAGVVLGQDVSHEGR